jgi:hypothetical protein
LASNHKNNRQCPFRSLPFLSAGKFGFPGPIVFVDDQTVNINGNIGQIQEKICPTYSIPGHWIERVVIVPFPKESSTGRK